MSLIDDLLDSLFGQKKPPPKSGVNYGLDGNPDKPWEPTRSDTAYYDPTFPDQVFVNPANIHEDHWTEAANYQYRGEEPHGISAVLPPGYDPHDIDLIRARGVGFGRMVNPKYNEPLPVVIVDRAIPMGVSRRTSMNSIIVSNATDSVRILARRPDRTRALIYVPGGFNTLFVGIGPTREAANNASASGTGAGAFYIPGGFPLELNTNEEIWAILSAGSPVALSVLEEFTVTEGATME